MTALRRSPSGPEVDLPEGEEAAGAQVAWAINPLVGNDNDAGTPSAPLRTQGEFNARLAGVRVSVAQTLDLVGDVLDAPLTLQNTCYLLGASLTVSGTRTTTATGTITVVTPLGPGGTLGPWQIDTTGITWSASLVTQQVQLSTGHTAMILEVVDADTVILGALGTVSSLVTTTAPTVGSTVTVASLSRTKPPVILAQGVQFQNNFQLVLQHQAFETGANSNGYAVAGGVNTLLFGCEVKQVGELRSESPLTLRCCAFSLTTTFNNNPNRLYTTQGCVVRGAGSTLFNQQTGKSLHSNLSLTGARLTINGSSAELSGVYIQKTANPVLVTNAQVICSGGTAAIHGATGNTGIGIDVTSGRMGYFSSSKPTVTGATDARVGGNAKTYAQIPFVAYDATAPTNLVGNGAAFNLE